METRENASLVLRTWDILQNNTVANNTDNAIGTITGNNAYITWKNINLRHLVGETMWNKYDKFNLCLSCYGMRPPASAIASAFRTASIWMSGLNWSNQTYNVVTKSLSDQTCLGIVLFGVGVTDAAIITISNNVATFNKSNEIVNITIEFKHNTTNTQDGYSEKPQQVLGHHTFVFDIVGCDDYKKNDTLRRF